MLLLPLILALAGCASSKVNFQTQKDPAYTGRIQRVMVVYPRQKTEKTLGRNFSDQLAQRLILDLGRRGVVCEVAPMDMDVLDREAPIRQIQNRFQPQQTIFFQVDGIQTEWVGAPAAAHREVRTTFECQVRDLAARKVVWRTRAEFGWLPIGEEVADALAKELEQAQLLPSFAESSAK